MNLQHHKCKLCGMIFVNSKELAKHQIEAHINKMLQCQSCNRIFHNRQEFKKHAIKVHGNSSSHRPNFKSNFDGDNNNIQYNNNSKEVTVLSDDNDHNNIE